MAYERLGDSPLDYLPCRYTGSKLSFRGPRRKLEGRYAAFLGGTDTYGKFIEQPFPALIEARTGVKCVNFGWPNAGVDVYLNDIGVQLAARNARLTVLQVPCVANMTNRFYSVHPRRNDRFLEASGTLRAMFGEVDFTEFHFVRHMLHRLQTVSEGRFGTVREEIQTAWVSRMQLLLQKLEGDVVLLWMSARKPEEDADQTNVAYDPSYVTREMIESLRSKATQLVEVTASDAAQAEGTKGMRFSDLEAPAAQEVLGPTVHYEVADALAPLIAEVVGS
ncbi:DUF6473 family protein [uncultured Roseovarius sp.]|uniref:DUF6473 family protein n=1 Tax=uncultured Roseovarius sp. TaxID=293344 RepID=UPI0026270AE0|nr:DUF6473 family protein [uncultured Roseovarius sp.]